MTYEEIELAQEDLQKYPSSTGRIISINSNNAQFGKCHLTLSKCLKMRILLGTLTLQESPSPTSTWRLSALQISHISKFANLTKKIPKWSNTFYEYVPQHQVTSRTNKKLKRYGSMNMINLRMAKNLLHFLLSNTRQCQEAMINNQLHLPYYV